MGMGSLGAGSGAGRPGVGQGNWPSLMAGQRTLGQSQRRRQEPCGRRCENCAILTLRLMEWGHRGAVACNGALIRAHLVRTREQVD